MKQALRKQFLDIRSNIQNKDEKNSKIFQGLVNFLQNFQCKKIFSYVSINSEVDTKQILAYYINKANEGFEIYVPYTKGKMQALRLKSAKNLTPDSFGNLSEDFYGQALDATEVEVVIVPLLAFNLQLNRLGYGMGCYDKFLAKSKALSIGLAFDEQYSDKLIAETHDILLDYIITPTKVLCQKTKG